MLLSLWSTLQLWGQFAFISLSACNSRASLISFCLSLELFCISLSLLCLLSFHGDFVSPRLLLCIRIKSFCSCFASLAVALRPFKWYFTGETDLSGAVVGFTTVTRVFQEEFRTQHSPHLISFYKHRGRERGGGWSSNKTETKCQKTKALINSVPFSVSAQQRVLQRSEHVLEFAGGPLVLTVRGSPEPTSKSDTSKVDLTSSQVCVK